MAVSIRFPHRIPNAHRGLWNSPYDAQSCLMMDHKASEERCLPRCPYGSTNKLLDFATVSTCLPFRQKEHEEWMAFSFFVETSLPYWQGWRACERSKTLHIATVLCGQLSKWGKSSTSQEQKWTILRWRVLSRRHFFFFGSPSWEWVRFSWCPIDFGDIYASIRRDTASINKIFCRVY